MKTTKATMTVEVEIEEHLFETLDELKTNLIGEVVKVKSGLYENAIAGWITDVTVAS